MRRLVGLVEGPQVLRAIKVIFCTNENVIQWRLVRRPFLSLVQETCTSLHNQVDVLDLYKFLARLSPA